MSHVVVVRLHAKGPVGFVRVDDGAAHSLARSQSSRDVRSDASLARSLSGFHSRHETLRSVVFSSEKKDHSLPSDDMAASSYVSKPEQSPSAPFLSLSEHTRSLP